MPKFNTLGRSLFKSNLLYLYFFGSFGDFGDYGLSLHLLHAHKDTSVVQEEVSQSLLISVSHSVAMAT